MTPLSLEQEAIAGNAGLSALWVNFGFRLRGALDVAALARALAVVLGRHDALRMRLERSGDQLGQRFVEPVEDLGLVPVDVAPEALDREAISFQLAPFDLEGEGPVRVALFRLAPGESVLLLNVHHLVMDRWAAMQFQEELWACYFSLTEARVLGLSESGSFQGLLGKQRDAGPRLRPGQLDYWRQVVDGSVATPLAGSDPSHPFSATAGTGFAMAGPETTAALTDLAGSIQVTMPALAAAALFAALWRETAAEDLTIWMLWSGRETRATRNMVSCLTRLFPLRCRMDSSLSVGDVARSTMQAILQGVMHSRPPYGHRRMLGELAATGNVAASAWAQRWYGSATPEGGAEVILNLATVRVPDLAEGARDRLVVEPYGPEPSSWTVDDRLQVDFGSLLVMAGVVADFVHLGAYYDPRHLAEATVASLCRHLEATFADLAGAQEATRLRQLAGSRA